MAMQFEYDETGSTFYYFMLAFMLLVFFPLTYIIWPFSKDPRTKRRTVLCSCYACDVKSQNLKAKRKNTSSKVLKLIILLAGWGAIAYFGYKAATTENTYVEYNPFTILGIDPGATTREIRSAYKKLSLTHHPDKGGDEETFVKINKAYQSLTDEATRKNWEEYGSPDGPQAMQFGIALPSWIVEKNNSVWVLGLYVLVFMIVLPVVVGTWWYKSIKYSADDILLSTTQVFFSLFARNALHNVSKCIMVLCSAFEFEKSQNKEVKEHASDNIQLPLLMKECRQLHEKSPLFPFRCPYSLKARTLFHSYLNRSPNLNEDNTMDIELIVKKMPALVSEALNICFQAIYFSKRQKNIAAPNVTTFENLIKINAMSIQALWDNSSPLLQLPHFTEDLLKYFSTKRSNVKTLLQFAQLSDQDRRSRLRLLGDEEYDNMMRVLWMTPHIQMDVKSEVIDDENTMTISAGSIVTVTVFLTRKFLRDVVDHVQSEEKFNIALLDNEEEKEPKKKSWQKPQKKQKASQKKKKVNAPKKKKADDNKENEDNKNAAVSQKVNVALADNDEDEGVDDGDDENESESERSDVDEEALDEEGEEDNVARDEDDDAEWKRLQQEITKKQEQTETQESHPVHCPMFPVDKEEGWWVFIADRKSGQLITPPKYVAGLKDTQEVILRFQAPESLGHYKYNVILKSDCYIQCEKDVLLKMLVEKELKTQAVKQWDNISETDESESESESECTNSDDESGQETE